MAKQPKVIENEELMKEWDWEKNNELGLDPTKLTCGANKKAWWTCYKCGYEWETKINFKSKSQNGCRACNRIPNTSFPEQVILFYLSKELKCENHKIIKGKEIDIFLSDLNIGIEYDGRYFHEKIQGKKESDIAKDKMCANLNIPLYRIKESNKNAIKNNIIYFKLQTGDLYSYKNLQFVISTLCKLLKLPNIKVDLQKDSLQIAQLYLTSPIKNSLLTQHPSIAKKWHPTKNGKLTPDCISSSSGVYCWWQCEKGHEWKDSVHNQVKKVHACPYCSDKKVIKGFNDISTCYPHILKYWDYSKNTISPSTITRKYAKKIWWKCPYCSYEWQSLIFSKIRKNSGCPKCAKSENAIKTIHTRRNNLINKGGSLADQHPEIAKEWHPTKNNNLTPKDVVYGSPEKVWWQCDRGHEWKATINSRSQGAQCPYCTNKKVLKGYNDLSTIYPTLIKEWNYAKNKITPEDVLPHSNKNVWWICEKGHEWQTTVANRVNRSGCPYCAGFTNPQKLNQRLNIDKQLFEELYLLFQKKELTKINFAKALNISRPTLDKLLQNLK